MLRRKRREPRTMVVENHCPCCHRCHVYVEGPQQGRCIYGGPFKGYVHIETWQEPFPVMQSRT